MVERPDLRDRHQDPRRHEQQRQRDRRQAPLPEPQGHQQQRSPEHRPVRAGREVPRQPLHPVPPRRRQPRHLPGLPLRHPHQRQQEQHHGRRRAPPAGPHPPRHPRQGQRHRVRAEHQHRQLVQQTGQGDDRAVRPPGPRGRRVHGPQEQQRRPGHARRDQRVGPPLLGVVAGHRRDGVEETGPQADPRSGQPHTQGRDQAGGHGRRAHRRQAQHDLARVDRQDGVHEQVVQAVHRVHVVQQPPDLRDRAPGDLEGDALVAPHAAAVQAPQPDPEHRRHGNRHGHRARAPRMSDRHVPILCRCAGVGVV